MRKYDKKVEKRLFQQRAKKFLTEQLRDEWDVIERGIRRQKRIDMTKAGAKAVGRALTGILMLGGIVTIAVVAPNIFAVMGEGRTYRRFFSKDQLQKNLHYMSRQNYTRTVSSIRNGIRTIRITEKGRNKVLHQLLNERSVVRGHTWDGKWYMVVFDIPDRHKNARDGLRRRLQALGLYRFQESVFVSPFPCREDVEFICWLYSVSAYVHIVEATELSNDRELRKHFSLT